VEGNEELGVGGEVGVGLLDVGLERLESETGDGQHRGRSSLSILDGVVDDGGLNGEDREGFLASETDVEEKLERFEGVGGKVVERVRGGDADSRDDTLGVAGGALNEGSELSGSLVDDVASNEVLNKLGEADEGEGEGDGSEVGDGGTRSRAGEPAEGVETLGVEGEAGLGRLGLERLEDLLGGLRQEAGNVGPVDVEEGLELVEVDLTGDAIGVTRIRFSTSSDKGGLRRGGGEGRLD
jgi:hypothetical protein